MNLEIEFMFLIRLIGSRWMGVFTLQPEKAKKKTENEKSESIPKSKPIGTAGNHLDQ